jgi:hypothetical protein
VAKNPTPDKWCRVLDEFTCLLLLKTVQTDGEN